MATEETTITELELAEEVLDDMVVAVDSSTDTKSVSLKQLRAWLGSSLPTGFILPAVGKINDERFTLLDGKTLSKTGTYGAFCAKVEEQVQAGNWFACTEEEYNADISAFNQCGKFVIGTDYVRIPTITRFIGATVTLSEIGKTYKESLPNIKGIFGAIAGWTPTGAFEGGENIVSNVGTSGNTLTRIKTTLNTSRSSSTYQDGAKVQPDHTKYPYYMVVSTEGQTSPIGIDINQVFEDIEAGDNRVTEMIKSSFPVGSVMSFAANSNPKGFIICNGAAVSRSTYSSLFAAIGTTYGEGDGSTTFNLPNLNNKFIMGSETAGTVKEAGLPNITGTFGDTSMRNDSKSKFNRVTGAFKGVSSSKSTGYGTETTSQYGNYVVDFNASRSSSIYGKSSTVQPPALTMRYFIKY